MNKIIESMKKLFAYKKSMIAILVIVSVLMTTGTFSYWAVNVQGEVDETSMTFRIGEYITTLFDFVLNEENTVYQYEVDVEYLFEDYKNNQDDVVFGIVWDDSTLSEEFENRIVVGNLVVDMQFKFYKNGIEVSAKTERQLNHLLKLSVDTNNPETITYGSSAETFEYYTMMNSRKKLNDVEVLLDYEVYVEITYTIDYK